MMNSFEIFVKLSSRRNCQLGDAMTTEYHSRHQADASSISLIDPYSLKFKPNSSQRYVQPNSPPTEAYMYVSETRH